MNLQCPDCQSYVDDSAAFCNHCGTNFQSGRRGSRPGKGLRSPRGMATIVLGVACVGAVVYFGWFHTTPGQEFAVSVDGEVESVTLREDSRESAPERRVELRKARFEAKDGFDDSRVLSPREVRALTMNAIVSLELFDADGDLLNSSTGILIDADGLVLTRFRFLLGATRGVCRARGRDAGLHVAGAVHVDLLRDLALLQLSEVRSDVWIDEALPGLPPLIGDEGREAIEVGFEVFVSGADKDWRSTAIVDTNYYSLEQVRRLRLEGQVSPGFDAFVALDPLAFIVGLCVTEESTAAPEQVDILVDPVHWLESHLDSERLESLKDLSAHYFDGTFAAYLYYGRKSQRKGEHENALGAFFSAMTQGAIERVEDEILDKTADLLRATLTELVRLWSNNKEWGRVAELLERGLETFPDNAEYWATLAAAYIHLQRYADSIPAALRARELRPGSEADQLVLAAYLRLAEEQKESGDLQAMSRVLLEGIEYLRESGRLHFELAKIYHGWDLLEDALRVFRIARQLEGSLAAEIDIYLDRIDDEIKRREAVIIPIREGASSITADVVLNGRASHEFLVDTGATLTAISQQIAIDLGYRLGPQLRWVRVRTANGVVEAPIVVLNSVSIQGFTVDNLEAIALPNTSSSLGLLGLNFLNHFKYTVDNKRRELRLERR
jgi:clan AA aspartic protease (TIGR02281 family)